MLLGYEKGKLTKVIRKQEYDESLHTIEQPLDEVETIGYRQ